jgi:acyl-CoA synthetase (AMP-forming)/AMP-acid ligase II
VTAPVAVPKGGTATIPAAVARAAREFGDRGALAEPDGQRLSYRELGTRVGEVARALIADGITPGDRVAVWCPNSAAWVLAALGALTAGATLVPVSTRFTGSEALDVIARSGARALFVTDDFLGADRLAGLRAAAAAPEAGGSLARLAVTVRVPGDWTPFTERGAVTPPATAEARARAVRPGDVSDILFTSGTTGRSKGAMSSHRSSLAVAAAWAGRGGLTAGDRYLVVNPFFHSFGLKAGILACLLTGATMVPVAVFDAAAVMRLIEAERVTVLPGAPTIYQAILDHPDRMSFDLSSLRLAVTGAANVPVALVERMRRELGLPVVLTAYGLTEAVVATMCRPGDDPETVARTCGRPAAGFSVRIAEGNGEVLLRGPNMMLGYLGDPAATTEAVDADGWLRTGDVGRLDAAGYLTITDRLKDMYICGGFNVYPAEVEQVLARLDGVAESAVVGVPDGRLGEVGKAYVVPRRGRMPDEAAVPDEARVAGEAPVLDEATVLDFCRSRLANYKVPRQVEFRDALPRNPSGKVLKRVLRGQP